MLRGPAVLVTGISISKRVEPPILPALYRP